MKSKKKSAYTVLKGTLLKICVVLVGSIIFLGPVFSETNLSSSKMEVFRKAEDLLMEGSYDDAEGLLKELQKLYPDDDEIIDILKDIETQKKEDSTIKLYTEQEEQVVNADSKALDAIVKQLKRDLQKKDKQLKATQDKIIENKALILKLKSSMNKEDKEQAQLLSNVENLESDIDAYESNLVELKKYLRNEQEQREKLEERLNKKTERLIRLQKEKTQAKELDPKTQSLAKARELISSQEYEEAEKLLITLKKDYPNDKGITSLLSYVGFKKVDRKKDRVGGKKTLEDVNLIEQRMQIKESIKSLIVGDTDSLTDDARRELARELYYEGMALYKEKEFKEAAKKMSLVLRLEKNKKEYYSSIAKKILDRIQEKVHKDNLDLVKTEEDGIDEYLLANVREYTEPPYVEPEVKKVSRAQKRPMVEMTEVRKKLTKTISFDFGEVSLKHVADFISQETGINIILSQKVLEQKPKVTARFSDLTAYDALKYLLKSIGLTFRIDEDLLWIAFEGEIATEQIETRVYTLIHGAGLLTDFSTSESSQAGVSSFASISKVETLEDTLRLAVDWPGAAKMTLDKRTNSLIVSNTPYNLGLIEEILYSIDTEPMQILVESRFVEVDVTDLQELGVEWKLNSELKMHSRDREMVHGLATNSGFDFLDFSNVSQGLNLTYKGVLTSPQFQVVLHALEKLDKTKTLSSPRVTTLNNQLATMKIVDEWIYPTRYELQKVQVDTDGDGSSTQAEETIFQNVPVDFVRRDVGIILKVIPSVGSDMKTVSLSIVPEVSEATADFFEYTGGVKMPRFSSRNLATTVAVNTGETVVLGGLVKESRVSSKAKVPVLGDMPLLGRLFRKESENIQRRSLLIFVTAKILSPNGQEMQIID